MKHTQISIVVLSFLLLIGGISYCYASESAYKRAHKAFLASHYEEAIIGYTEYLKQKPHNENAVKAQIELSEAYFKQANKYYDQRDYETARKLYYSANTAKGDKKVTECVYKLAQLHYNKGDYETALKLYQSTNTKEGYNGVAECIYALAKDHYQKGEYALAIDDLNKLIDGSPESPIVDQAFLLKMKIEFENLQNESECLDTYKDLVGKCPYSKLISEAQILADKIAPDYIKKGDRLLSQKEFEEALELYSSFDNVPTGYSDKFKAKKAKAYINWAVSYRTEGKLEKAIQVLEEAKRNGLETLRIETLLTKTKISSFLRKGDEAFKEKDWSNASTYYTKVLELDEDNKKAHRKLKDIDNAWEKAKREEEERKRKEREWFSGRYYYVDKGGGSYLGTLYIDAPTSNAAVHALLEALRKYHKKLFEGAVKIRYGKSCRVVVKHLGTQISRDGLTARVKIRTYVVDKFGERRAGQDEYESSFVDIDKEGVRWKLKLNLSSSVTY